MNVAAAEAALARVCACEPVLWESPAETRERLERHSELVWSMADKQPAPKVFSMCSAWWASRLTMSVRLQVR